jgi:hypothetical protein
MCVGLDDSVPHPTFGFVSFVMQCIATVFMRAVECSRLPSLLVSL